ncbi:ATP-binding cassette domain-containing protein [Aphanizomenon flos-aquae NRERC-008]|jgi:ABC-2 type transport system ATP-binding protein|uniref:ATP-binding cassette domain-containing protein n=1 Tax=Aphanizomenon flos-aquae FACHB-1249 TaxID=2692889 RepID=A0ABR8ILI2_APHFL|nr:MULTISPECIES: ATP-binding cassette domain-containing protein [Aphanizomenon]MCE2904572.1 ATP-binding cassette domain-containing protein [Anabaena sp. CoA2_C59]MDJ0506748.1 ATP-binding cassette domain-containing protein [Nostocales cyanobacterium LE14-WE12]MBD2391485.1 ATP-binding cassette domain-containing protein [Aphanizomenon flos-aquae FACHB-1171]MBD2557063.1 ATP-binding cassette domain-containing protein [Aphanizomenon flos-aquae FACHB-1290]MBD2630314.1 ATP-binding cassette domain-cont
MSIIIAENLNKSYPVAIKNPGIGGTITHFFRRTYRQIKAVQDVSFTIEPGEIVGFLGPNGAGKTTTLKMLTGLIHPSSGIVKVGGFVPFRRQAVFLQKITLVMGQKQQLMWDLPALDSLKINAAVYNISDKDFQRRVGELTEMLALEGKLTQPVRKLSLGERMKAEILAALLHRPQVLFLDEPTLGLDINAQVGVRDFLKEYNQLYQATILLTSHYMADITALCQRVLLIHEGKLMYDGILDELLESFAPYREIYVELAQALPLEKLMSYGDVQMVEGRTVRFIVQQEELTRTVSQILADLEVVDLTVTEPPVEEVIGRVFEKGFI